MNCGFSVDISKSKALQALKDYCGENSEQFLMYINSVVKGQAADGSLVPSTHFEEWYKQHYKNKPNFDAGSGSQMRDRIIRYFKEIKGDVESTYRDGATAQILSTYGYTSPSARDFCKRVTANFVLDFYNQTDFILRGQPEKYAKVQEEIKKVGAKTFYFNRVKARFNRILAERIAAHTGEDIKTVQNKLKSEGRFYAETALGKKNMSVQDSNLVALVYEFQTSPAAFVEEVSRDSRLYSLFNKTDEFDDNNQPDAEGENNPENEADEDNEDFLNTTISMYDHTGTYTNAMMHVDTGIRAYLSSLKKLNSGIGLDKNQPDLDLNNPLGIADTMNADECVTILYHYGNYDNVDSMIESIKAIANNIPGFAAFHQLAKDLESDSDIAYQFYTTFGKTIISKVETTVEGSITRTRISNNHSNKLEALGFEFMNSVKTTAIDNDLDFATDELANLRDRLRSTKQEILKSPDNKFRKAAIAELAKQLRRYYPTISDYAVENYINSHKENGINVDVDKNFGNLITILENTIKYSEGTKIEYENRQLDINEAYRHNRSLERKQLETNAYIPASEFIDLAPLYAKPYTTKEQNGAALELAKALVDYSLVRVENNSRTIHGNQSSDVINNSYITNILKTLQNDTSLTNYGKYRANSRQYDFSGIMIEHVEDGVVVNRGLFRYNDDGELVPTEYAKDLLKITLFNGASNLDTDTNVAYNQMSQGDYIGTGFINFFSAEDKTTANYFMRVPSDAPRNFSIKAPRYSAAGLFSIANQSEVNAAKLAIRKKVTEKGLVEDAIDWGVNDKPFDIYRSDQAIRHMTADAGEVSVKLPDFVKGNKEYKEGEEITVKFKYKSDNSEDNQDVYLVRGTVENGRLVNGTFLGVVGNNFSSELSNAFDRYTDRTIERQGIIQYAINRNHPLFKQFRNAFKQELLDAAVGINKFFVTNDDGLVQRYSENEAKMLGVEEGSVKWKDGVSKDGRQVSGAYENYHHKKGKIVEKKEGRETLVGNVFHSDRFVIFDRNDNEVRNYGEELLEEIFSFLYGGADNTYLHVTKNADGSVKEVNLTDAQQEAVDNKIEEFIVNYIEQGFNRLSNVEGSLKGTELTHDTAAEFLLNYHMMYINFNDLFEGDTKFYGTSRDFLKRAKEAQGSGVPYGLVDYNADLGATKTEVTRSILTGTVFANGYKVKQYNKFSAVTVVNTIMTNESAIKTLRNKLIKDCKLSEEDADRLLAGYTQGTKVNDAQSYITFDEWIRRVAARGQLMRYKPLIDKILNEEELNAEELSEFVQVQKNFYYDQYYDKNAGVLVPRQIKNAEFVLIPQLIKGTELEVVAAIMNKYDIDQLNTVETTKAGKTDILEIFDAKTGEVKQDIIDEVNGKGVSSFGQKATAASELFSYNYLYTQQETPQHVNAENKAGIQIMKKMLDNITPDSKLWETKQRFFKLYSANIRDSFQNLMQELNLEVDENGNLVLEEDADGNKTIKGLNVELFCQRLKEECMRLGLDSNMLDYVTLDATRMAENGFNTIMPNYMSMVSQKLESIAQSLFNSRITRQKLPGFHAAQITNVGFKSTLSKEAQKTYAKDLKYHQDEKGNYVPYVEIMLPASAFGFKRTKEDGTLKTKEELLKELQDAKLDEIVGYRIPTEGKQSVCRMKVVGFIDDAYGSTIVVPNDWVTQTGSDFDIDSVYGIQFETYVDKEGHIQKTEYIEDKENLYKSYVLRQLTREEREAAFERAKLPETWIQEIRNKYDNAEYFDNDAFIAELKSNSNNILFGILESIAEEKGLKSFEEYSKGDIDELNSRASRNNGILQCMLDILGSDEALEENLSRSNFDDISHKEDPKTGDRGGAVQKNMSEAAKKEVENRSAYNFLDQAAYQEDAMSGARLKGYSVTRDTFCSICNTVRPTITKQHQVKVVYSTDMISYNKAVERFGKENVEKQGDDKIIITHDRLGWSNDNKNVVGKILTAYSSQTTAHILDAIKEGAVPNVNELTFAVFKIFPDLGIDYDTAVAFMMQDGIRRIVDAYNSTNSIYQESRGDYINKAIRDIARELGMNISGVSNILDVVSALQKRFGADFAKIFGKNAEITLNDDKIAQIAINGQQLQDEISTPRRGKDKLLFDLGVVLQYSKLSHFGNSITALTRVCNPDKFGAKQTIFATNKIFDDIKDILDSDNPIPLEVKGTNFLEAIYPDVDKTLDDFITAPRQESAYPPLYNFLKYATATSIKINRSLFTTQSPEFINAVRSIERLLSDNGKLTEKQYKDIEKYIIGHLYNTCQSIMRPLTFAVNGNIGFVPVAIENEDALKQEELFNEERRRIFGYGASPEIKLEIANVHEPTQEEVNAFAKLTPAQKVAYIQGHFSSAGVFNYIRTNLFNERAARRTGVSGQTIEFIDTLVNIEDVYQAFVNAFSSTNPLVALTAYDVIKYAFAVEGYKLKRNGVSKMIPNSVLYNDFGIYGTGIVQELDGKVRNIGEILADDIEKIQEDYIRGHNMYQIPSIKVQKPKGKGYELVSRSNGIIQLGKDDESIAIAEKYRIVYRRGQNEAPTANAYVRLTFGKRTALYKIDERDNSYYLYPLNNLEENEHGEFSSNVGNNVYPKEDYYLRIINDYESQFYDFDASKFREIADKYNIEEFKAPKEERVKVSHAAKEFSLEHPADNMIGAVDKLKKDVQRHFGDEELNNPLYVINAGLHNAITHPGYNNGTTKLFTINKGTANERVVRLNVYGLEYSILKRLANKYLGKNTGKQISKGDEKYKDIIKFFRDNGIVHISEDYPTVFVVRPAAIEDDGLRRSSLVETGTIAYKAINRRLSSVEDEAAVKANQRLRDKGITTDKNSVANHIDEVIRTSAEYVATVTEKTINGLKYFAEDPNGNGYLSVTDPGVIDLIKNDPALIRKFLKTILDAEAIVSNFKTINELDIKSQDPELQRYLNKIKDCVNDLQNNALIRGAKESFANNYLAKLSSDPLIQQDILNILDGYHSTNSFTAWVNDLQETTNPFIQVLSKQVIADIRAKEFEAVRRVRAWQSFVKGIKAKAAAAGKTINWDNIIDEDGRFIQEYTQSLVDDMNQMRDAIASAKATYGEGSIEHLEAQLKYNKWKLEHINQELEDDYYRKRIELDEAMLHGVRTSYIDERTGRVVESEELSGGYPIVFTEYKKLEARRRDILSHTVNGVLDDYWKQQLEDVNKQIHDLTSPLYYDPATGNLVSRVDYDKYLNPITGTEEEKRKKILYSAASQRAITKYIKDVSQLNTEYYGYDVEFGFEEELQRNLHIVESYESRDANGNIRTPMNLLMENDEYVRAKEWLATNARFVVSLADDSDLVRKLNEANKVLRKDKGAFVLGRLAKDRNAYDNRGVIDGTKFTDDDIKAIKADQQAAYSFREDAPFSDKGLISNASPTGEVYTAEFYKHMTSDGTSNPEWIAKVHEINELLAPYYDNGTKTIRFDLIPNTDEGRALLIKLGTLYDSLQNTKKTANGSNGKQIAEFIEGNVDFNIDEAEFEKQRSIALQKGNNDENSPYMRAWNAANYEVTDEGRKPNHYIYGYATPKPAVKEKYLDKKKTEALQLINKTYTTTPTEYYYQKVQEVKQQGKEAFDKWYHENHIYNPYTHTYEPLRCWTTRTFRDTSSATGKWEANMSKRTRRPNPEHINPNYKPEVGNALNYKKGSGYDNSRINDANEFENELKLEMQKLLSDLVKTKFGRRFIDKGYLPARRKEEEHDAKFWGKELLKTIGWVEGHSGEEPFYEDLDYARDKTIPMPMLSLIGQKTLESLNIKEPKREEYNTDAEYATAVEKYNKDVEELKETNRKAHRDALDRNWEEVIKDFILQASHFNAVQDNKYMLFYGKSMLENMGVYQRKYGFFGDYKKDYINSDDTTTEYIKRKDKNLISQYENWVRRIVYDQWKESNGMFTKWASRLQSITSAQYMMMNIRGGIANVTLGETNIVAEAFAKEYFGTKEWLAGKSYWMAGIPSYFANAYKPTSTSVADAIIKFFNVVDFDELTGKSRIIENPVSEGMRRFTGAMYSPQNIGENFMQNGAMFSMMMSHRLYEIEDPETHKKTIVFKNEHEAMRDAEIQALRDIIKDSPLEERFNEFIKSIKDDANKMKDYAWRRKDFVTQFVKQYLKGRETEYIAKRKARQDEYKRDFYNDEAHPRLIDQFALGDDQQLSFKKGSKLSEYDIPNQNGEPSEAYKLLANFRGRVISVNKKIHGIYDRLGQAQLEKLWYGSLVMQYHKHMYPGILKRWRREGSYNEERGTVEKGCYIALMDFLATPWRQYKEKLGMNDAQVETMEGTQNLLGEIVDFVTNIQLNWNLLPEHERANIRRCLGDVCGVLSALFMAIALRAMMDDDDEDSILFNLGLYEADRLASESFQFNPLGMYSEAKKLWSTPIAAQSGLQDIIQSCGLLSKMIIEGEDFDPYYHSGRFAGEHKLSVYVQRRIPIWRGIKTGFIDIVDSNSYYKMGDNMLGILPVNHWANLIKGEED